MSFLGFFVFCGTGGGAKANTFLHITGTWTNCYCTSLKLATDLFKWRIEIEKTPFYSELKIRSVILMSDDARPQFTNMMQ